MLDLACQVFLASIGALSLMLLTGYAGQISLGHAGLIAAGAFTAGILFKEVQRAVLGHAAGCGAGRRRCSALSSACRRCGCAGSISRSARSRCISSSSISAANTRPSAASRPAS